MEKLSLNKNFQNILMGMNEKGENEEMREYTPGDNKTSKERK